MDASCSSNQMFNQYRTWCTDLKSSIQEKTQSNFFARLQKIESIVNHIVSSHLLQSKLFVLGETEKLIMLFNIRNKITEWKGVDIQSCKFRKKTYKEYAATGKNWFNRNKSRIYGNHFFSPLIFCHILKYCLEIKTTEQITNNVKMCVFIDILVALLTQCIQFAMSKPQPLLLHQSLTQSNKFKHKCKDFLIHYNIQWDPEIIISSCNSKHPSKEINESFKKHLLEVKYLLQHSVNKPYSSPTVSEPISINFDNLNRIQTQTKSSQISNTNTATHNNYNNNNNTINNNGSCTNIFILQIPNGNVNPPANAQSYLAPTRGPSNINLSYQRRYNPMGNTCLYNIFGNADGVIGIPINVNNANNVNNISNQNQYTLHMDAINTSRSRNNAFADI